MNFRWLLDIASWLDRRFPPKVVLTKEQYEELDAREHRQSKRIADLSGEILVCRERLGVVEKTLAAVKEAIAKGHIEVPTDKSALRDAFVKGEFERFNSIIKTVAEAA